MALSDILAAIDAETTAECEALAAAAAAKVAEIDARAGRAADAAALEIDHAARARLSAEVDRLRSAVRLEAARDLRSDRERGFRRLLDAVQDAVPRLRDAPTYPRILAALVDEGLEALPEATRLRVPPEDRAAAAEVLRDPRRRLELEVDADARPGVSLSAPDGRRVDNTFATRSRLLEPRLRLAYADEIRAAGDPRPDGVTDGR